ncbi:MAG: hypothetical protein M3511_08780, partial [Deinococcota bacterium]|nr:hypothetical protein [Deinococcota bacterium]
RARHALSGPRAGREHRGLILSDAGPCLCLSLPPRGLLGSGQTSQSDIYSFGVVAYELIARACPNLLRT